MSDFNIQQVKAKLEKDLKEAAHVSKAFEKDLDSLEKRMETLNSNSTKDSVKDDSTSEVEENKILEKMQTEFDESLNKAVLDFDRDTDNQSE